jgi:site-specific DNA-methyltransferase (adenine-specific)/modification methylase
MDSNGDSWKAAFPKPDWEAEDVLLYRRDCLEILPKLPDGCVDAVVTDPPYGVNWTPRVREARTLGDDRPFDPAPWLTIGRQHILWGAQHYANCLSNSGGWLIWIKRGFDGHRGASSFGSADLAWTDCIGTTRYKRHVWDGGMCQGLGRASDHPCEKPLEVMRFCMEIIDADAAVCDPYMGSGTTGVACVQTGRRFVGIELEPTYFDIAVKRMEAAIRDDAGRFAFAKAKAPDPQEVLFDG